MIVPMVFVSRAGAALRGEPADCKTPARHPSLKRLRTLSARTYAGEVEVALRPTCENAAPTCGPISLDAFGAPSEPGDGGDLAQRAPPAPIGNLRGGEGLALAERKNPAVATTGDREPQMDVNLQKRARSPTTRRGQT